ncbi:MAG TPA: adenylate/guanylate cyclase domain-containing protein [Microthrixaceae bacterium]|nr:adenylate/guanylate cyclase domain-containing protein [Microthrixaceae bacterium]
MAANHPSGTVTFLFTDIVNSTVMWDRHPDVMSAALARHDELLRRAIEAHGGYVFTTGGDGFGAAFSRAEEAVSAAREAQTELCAVAADDLVPIRVRMGIHTGEVSERDGDYFGMPVNVAARIMALGVGRQVLLSGVTADLVSGKADVVDLGTRRLRNVEDPVPIRALVGPELVTDPPPGGGTTTVPPLPTPARDLIGRELERSKLTELLLAHRLVTVLGPGGVGKTRLALEVARHWSERGDLVGFIALSAVSDAASVPNAMCDGLGLRRELGVDAMAVLREFLRNRPALLVLDNFEQVAGAAPHVATLLEDIDSLRILVTSRQRLRLLGEQSFELDPLAVNGSGASPEDNPAVELFAQVARMARSDFVVGPDNVDDVVAICRAVDGLPLAVELVAAQLRHFPLSYVRDHLESRAATLADDAPDRPDRHRTVRDTIAWGHDLLGEDERRLFAHLAVFSDSFSLAAVVAISDGDPLPTLANLVDKSLVRQAPDARAEPRYVMLHLIRDFAAERFREDPEREEVARRHALYVIDLAEEMEEIRWRRGGRDWTVALNSEAASITAALDWSFEHDPVDLGCRLLAALAFWWHRSGRLPIGRVWVERGLQLADRARPEHAGRIYMAAGYGNNYLGDVETARVMFEKARAFGEAAGDHRVVILSACNIAISAIGDPDRYWTARTSVQSALVDARSFGEQVLVIEGLVLLGELERTHGRLDVAEESYKEALELSRSVGDPVQEAISLSNLGQVALARGDRLGSLSAFMDGLDKSWEVSSRMLVAWSLTEAAGSFAVVGRPELAATLVGGAEASLQAMGAWLSPADVPVYEDLLATLADELGAPERDRLRTEGRGLTLEQATQLAVTGLAGVRSEGTRQ